MKLKKIIEFINEKIPQSLALSYDKVGFKGDYDLNQDIKSVKIYMDLLPRYDADCENTLIITHHSPLFVPKTPTYVIHSNWDIMDGGANDALAETLKLEVVGYFDDSTKIGRVCRSNQTFAVLKRNILDNFTHVRIVNKLGDDEFIENVGIVSGFGLKNPYYTELARDKNLDILISGDLTQECAILAKNLGVTLIDLNHHESEVPGLHALGDVLSELDVDIEIIDEKPIEELK
ncbi:Nif3-like dinuclear metal center hexameric protein [Methanobrevibacter sp.]|uniref:Nif3-like dinuclear metal center hexameric protein n=1 Tax=Methanobrevibacter sp. TaxID=66852 RepID=UPI00389041AC